MTTHAALAVVTESMIRAAATGDVNALIAEHWKTCHRHELRHGVVSVFTRDSVICYSAYRPRQFRLSVSVIRVLCIKTAESIIEILSPSDRPIILVFSATKNTGIVA